MQTTIYRLYNCLYNIRQNGLTASMICGWVLLLMRDVKGTCGHAPLLPAQYGVQLLRDVRHLMVQVPRQLLPHAL